MLNSVDLVKQANAVSLRRAMARLTTDLISRQTYMEKSTPIGLIIGFAMMLGVLLVGESDISLMKFVDPPAIMMVFGGALAVAMVGFPLSQVFRLFPTIKRLLLYQPDDANQVIDKLVELAEAARKEGILALEQKCRECSHPLMKLGIQLAVDGTQPDAVQQILRTEIEAASSRHRENKKLLELIGRCGPAFGMIATLLGLIMMLGNLDNPDTIGPSMAVALIGTLYGAVMANLICIPLTEKLSHLDHEEMLIKEIVLRGVMGIQAGDNPRIVRYKLETFLPIGKRQAVREEVR
jgi:chemotaxis protein MotA